MHSLTLPATIAGYFASEHDPEALAQCFAADAVMKDDGHTYQGIDAIKAFMAMASLRYNARTVPFAVRDEAGFHVVDATVSGNFPGSPARLTYRFGLQRGLIESLEISV